MHSRYRTPLSSKVALVLGLSLAAVAVPSTAADIRDTKHNLSGKSSKKSRAAVVSDDERRLLDREVCVFCHTPTLLDSPLMSGADDGDSGGGRVAQALWQRSVPPGSSFSMFDDIGRVGVEGAGPVGSVSMACLSCHDSNQAFGVSGTTFDHPFGIPYMGTFGNRDATEDARQRLRNNPTAAYRFSTSPNLDSDSFRPVQSAVIGGRRVWWASTVPSAQRSKSDLPLYPRHNPNLVAALAGQAQDVAPEPVPFVECTSCHDPHTTRDTFLRRTNAGGSLCMTCHAK